MSDTVTLFKMKPLCSAVLAAALFVSLPVSAATDKPRIIAETEIQPVATLSAQESQAMSLAAGRVLLHSDNARIAIVEEDKETALKEIKQGLILVKLIENTIPKYKVTTTIKAGDMTYRAEDEVNKHFVSVFNEQYIEDIVAPVVQAKSEADEKKSNSSPGIEDYAIWRQSSMKLNIALAADALALARKELEKGHFDNADVALTLLQTEGVVFEYSVKELPLTSAADDLKLAQLEVSEGKTEQAQATLKRASDNLKKYESLSGESRAKEVRKLHNQIDKLAQLLAKGDHSESALKKAGKEIGSFWDRVVKWFK
ncbi:hypothetical protein MNBD_GAMMA19-1238 [hydrothermal vent metagenome]|uniref:YfdX protein n=1 Tax=hydrothermal vent metagenome TaxID=652676 RepID=A0A3B1A980_9ZZZZ